MKSGERRVKSIHSGRLFFILHSSFFIYYLLNHAWIAVS